MVKDLERLPDTLRNRSISDEEIIVSYDDALLVLDFFHESKYAALGFEVLRVTAQERTEIRTFVSYFPDSIVWEEFVDNAYGQVKNNLVKVFEQLCFSDEGDEDLYVLLTFVNRQEFEDYYYDYVVAD